MTPDDLVPLEKITVLFDTEPIILQTPKLNFIHIPKTAGTFIEAIAQKSGIEWGKVWFNKRGHLYDWTKIIDNKYDTICYQLYHLPPRTFNQVINASYGFDYYDRSKYSSFCVVRDPYRRIFSEYLWNIWWNKYDHMDINESVSHDYLNKHGHSIDHYCNVDIMNGIINEWLRSAINEKRKIFYNNNGCHLLPQYLYIFDNDDKTQICDHIINMTDLISQLQKLFTKYEYQDTIKYKKLLYNLEHLPKLQSQQLCLNVDLSIRDFTDETIHNINLLYDQDFKLLNFTKIFINRTTQSEFIWIENEGSRYKQYYIEKYPDNFTVLQNHPNQCKILPIEEEQSFFHGQKQKILQPLPYEYPIKRNLRQEPIKISDNITIVLCVRLRNELRYLFEWIEYHHFIQEIDYIWIFDHYSVDRLHLLTNIYGNEWLSVFKITHEGKGYAKCLSMAQQLNITFVALWDVDEFVYTIDPSLTIKQYLINFVVPNNISHVQIHLYGFGTYTDDEPFKYDIDNDKAINANSQGILTVIGRYLYRLATYNESKLVQKYKVVGCKKYHWRGNIHGTRSVCQEGWIMKAITKTSDCLQLTTHNCKMPNDTQYIKYIKSNTGIKGNHYLLRYHQNFFKRNWGKYDKWAILFSDANEKFFNAVYDPELALRYHLKVSKQIKYNLLNCSE